MVVSQWLAATEVSLPAASKTFTKTYFIPYYSKMPYFIHFYPYISYKVTLHFKSLTISPHSVATALFLPLHHRRRGGQRLEEISFITSTRIPCSFIFSISFTRWPWEELVVRSKYFLLISPYYVFFFFLSLFKHNYSISSTQGL